MTTLELHVGDETAMAGRFLSAWHRAERGEPVDERHLTFLSLEALLSTLSPDRLALLRWQHHQGAASEAEIGQALGLSAEAVRTQVADLETAGLVLRDGDRLAAPWDRLFADLAL